MLFKVVVTNKTEGPILANIGITQKESAVLPINVNWPVTGIKGDLQEGETAILAFLTKIEPSETADSKDGATEIQKLDFSLSWKHDNERIARIQEAIEKKIREEKSTSKESGKSVETPKLAKGKSGGSGNEPQEETSSNDSELYKEVQGPNSPKTCGVCTYENLPSATECEMCTTTL